MREWRNGSRCRLKICWEKSRTGSSPVSRTKTFMKLKQVTIPLYMVYDKDGHPILVDNLAKYDNEEVDVITEDDWDDEGNNCGVSYGYLK